MQVSASSFGQTVSASFNNSPIEKVFKEITRQTGYSFIYTRAQLKQTKPVTLLANNEQLEDVLRRCFENQPLTFLIEDKYIVVQSKPVVQSQAPVAIDVSGKVINENDEPLPGVTVTVKKTGRATSTNEKGEFVLTGIAEDDVLVITSIGYYKKEIAITKRANFIIILKIEVSSLDETVVIAYGTTTKRYNTGSITKITAEEIAKQPVANPLAALQGRAPGLVVTSTSGLPGSSFTVQIRGQNSVNPNPSVNAGIPPIDNPLFIIDGVPFAPQNYNINQLRSISSPGNNPMYGNQYSGVSPFNTINPADIESIEILRDADATAIYGSRAANGVILITTKKGKPGKTKFNLNVSTGQSRITRSMSLLNTSGYLAMRREAYNNDGLTPNANPGTTGYAPDLLLFDASKYTDWKKYFLGGSAGMTMVNGAISGGTAQTNFLIGAGHTHQNYILPGDFTNYRTSLNTNLRHNSDDKKFDIDLSMNYSFEKNNSSGNQFLLQSFILPPNYPDLLNEAGDLVWSYRGAQLANPLSYLKQRYTVRNYNLNSHLQIGYEFVRGFSFNVSIGYNTFNGKEESRVPQASIDPISNAVSSARFGSNEFQTWLVEPQLEYRRKIWKGLFTVLAGGTYQKNTNTQLLLEGAGFPNDDLLGSISAASVKNVTDAFFEKKYIAVFARINYLLLKRYIISLNGRRDGSSRFGPGKQFGNFGSVGAGWIFSEESFVKKRFVFLSFGKIRTSYGVTGSDNISDYQYLSRWGVINPPYQTTVGYAPQNLYNAELHWSLTRKYEAGLELGFFKDRLFLNAVWYQHQSNNQLVTYVLPSQTGFRGITANFPALVENSGLEIQLSATNVRGSSFNWSSGFNLTIPRNRLVEFPGIKNSSYANVYVVGQSLSVLNLYRYLRVDPNTGTYEFETKNGSSNNPSNADRYVFGNLDPKFYGGLSNTLSYKGWQLDLFLEFKKQIGANYLQQVNTFLPGLMYNQPQLILERWQKPGNDANIQKFTSQTSTIIETSANAFMRSDGAYGDASYVRLKTLSLSYDVQRKKLERIKLSAIRLYLNAQNLFVITRYQGNDPETKSFYSLPPLRTLVAGLQLTF